MNDRREPLSAPDGEALALVRDLLESSRQATLATADADGPYTAMVAFAPTPDFGALVLHLSDLALHKRQLRGDPRAALLVARPDDGRTEILQHPRLSLRCRAEIVAEGDPLYPDTRACYLAKYPKHELMFRLPDFDLFRLVVESGLLNAGFGRAFPLTARHLRAAARGN